MILVKYKTEMLELKMPGEVEELTKKLIAIASVSEDERKMCQFLWSYLGELGFEREKVGVDKNGFNIVVKVGKPKIYFSGHMDTVPGKVR